MLSFINVTKAQKQVQAYPLQKQWAFEENKGQFTADGKQFYQYFSIQKNLELKISHKSIAFEFYTNSTSSGSNFERKKTEIKMNLVNASQHTEIIPSGKNLFYKNYYTVNGDEILHVYSYHNLLFKDIYPNIDMELLTEEHGFKYSFILHPGANPNNISIQWEGLDKIRENEFGLAYLKDEILLQEKKVYSFDDEGSTIGSKLLVNNNNQIKFELEKYNSKRTITIDPSLSWGTFFGGTSTDYLKGLAVDSNGNAYVAGITYGSKNLATHKSFDTSVSTGFFSRFDSSGKLIWSTYYPEYLQLYIATDNRGHLYLTGAISGTPSGFATKGAFQTTNKSASAFNAFLSKFDTSGKRIWATCFGGISDERGSAITTDTAGNVIFTGTSSSSGLASSGAWRSTTSDIFVAKFSSAGKRLWSTYYGGPVNASVSQPTGIKADQSGNIYVSGYTADSSGFTSALGWQPKKYSPSGMYSSFLACFTSSGNLKWGTYYGGYGETKGLDVACDENDHVYMILSGISKKDTLTTYGSYEYAPISSTAGCLVKFDSTGHRKWGTYFNGGGQAMNYDISGLIHIIGYTNFSNGVSTPNAYQRTIGTSNKSNANNICITTFDTSGPHLYGTYYGGNHNADYLCDITTNKYGEVYIIANTQDDSGFATSGAYQLSNKGSYDGIIAKFSCPIPVLRGMNRICGQSINTYFSHWHPGSSYTWSISGGTIISGASSNKVLVKWGNSGTGKLSVIENCSGNDTSSIDINLFPTPKPVIMGDSIFCNYSTKLYTAPDSAARMWTWRSIDGKILGSNHSDSASIYWIKSGYDSLWLTETNIFACKDSVSKRIEIKPLPNANFTSNPDTGTLAVLFVPLDSNLKSYSWNFGDSTGSTNSKIKHLYKYADTFRVSLQVIDSNSCISMKDSLISVKLITGLNINSSSNSFINIYPNPFSSYLNFSFSDINEQYQINIFDFTGKLVRYKKVSQSINLNIDCSDLAPSIYTLIISNSKGNIAQYKIVKSSN